MDKISQGIIEHGSLESYIDSLHEQIYTLKGEHRILQRAVNQENSCKVGKPLAHKYAAYKKRAEEKGMEMNIKIEDFELLLSMPCHYCGRKSTTLDRIDSNFGYMYGNVNPSCLDCNMMKRQMQLEEFLTHVARIHKYSNI